VLLRGLSTDERFQILIDTYTYRDDSLMGLSLSSVKEQRVVSTRVCVCIYIYKTVVYFVSVNTTIYEGKYITYPLVFLFLIFSTVDGIPRPSFSFIRRLYVLFFIFIISKHTRYLRHIIIPNHFGHNRRRCCVFLGEHKSKKRVKRAVTRSH